MADPAAARHHNRLGYLRLNENDFDRALEEFTAATELDPDNTSFRYTKITVMEKMGRTAETIAEYDALIARDPGNIEYYLGKAKALESGEHLNRAIDVYDRVIEIHPHNPELHYEKSMFFGRYESYDRAIHEMEAAIDLNPEEPKYLHGLCELYQIVEEDKIALLVYERLIGVDNCNPQYHYEKARILERIGKVDQAADEMQSIGKMRPHSITWSITLSEFFETHEMYENALDMRNRILELEPENWENYEDRAGLLEMMELSDRAEKDRAEAEALRTEFNSKYVKK